MIELTALPIDITKHILLFRSFLNSCWTSIDILMEMHDWDEDVGFIDYWIQVNWEFLVERELLGKNKYLLPLGWNKRVTFPEKEAQYKVVCETIAKLDMKDRVVKTNNYNNEELLVFSFCTPKEGYYGMYPPFDFVEVRPYDKKKTYIIPINCCRFWLKLI